MEYTTRRLSGTINRDTRLETTLYINSNNPTLVAAWNLTLPSFTESSKVLRVLHSSEALGRGRDHRVRVPREAYLPGGKYGAVCKLFMTYLNKPEEEYVGTGWLVANDVIVTAAHCVVEPGDLLKNIKVYFGYSGPESVGTPGCIYRYGIAVAAPAEYLKAQAHTHDVGFVHLNAPVDNIQPIRYMDTPTKTAARLGVVGYPGELDFGNYMYEYWQYTTIDLADSNISLTYKIDPTGSQSGSPVFMDGHSAIGVHVGGGYPNYGSVIGQAGNRFDEYLLALDVKQGQRSKSATIVHTRSQVSPAPGFQLISVRSEQTNPEPTKLYNGVNGVNGYASNRKANRESALIDVEDSSSLVSEDDGSTEEEERTVTFRPGSRRYESEPETIISSLFGRSRRTRSRQRGGKTLAGVVLDLPERLRRTESGLGFTPSLTDYKAATQKAADEPDVKTTFFVNFPPTLQGDAKKQTKKLIDSIQSWQAWSSSICEAKVQQQIDAKALPADSAGQFARSTYRAKVFDYLFRQASWFAKTFDQDMSKHIQVRKADFHTAILQAVLNGFTVPQSVFFQLEAILRQIGDTITLNKQQNNEKQQYWIMFTRYDYQPEIETVQPVIRVISFIVDQKMSNYTSNKVNYTDIDIELQFGQYQADFIARIYKKIQKSIDQGLVDAGMKLVQQQEFNIPV